MRIVFGLTLVGALCAMACGGGSKSTPSGGSGGSGADSAGGADSLGGSGNHPGGGRGNSAGDGPSDGGEAGAVDVPVVSTATPHAAGGLVAGGVVAHSAHFTGVFSLGAAPGGNGVLTSATRQLRGGVVGASQK